MQYYAITGRDKNSKSCHNLLMSIQTENTQKRCTFNFLREREYTSKTKSAIHNGQNFTDRG